MKAQDRIALDEFPKDWSYFTLTYPVARFGGLTSNEAASEMLACSRRFYSIPRMLRRLWRNVCRGQSVWIGFAGALSYRRNIRIDSDKLGEFEARCGSRLSFEGEGNGEHVTTSDAVLERERWQWSE